MIRSCKTHVIRSCKSLQKNNLYRRTTSTEEQPLQKNKLYRRTHIQSMRCDFRKLLEIFMCFARMQQKYAVAVFCQTFFYRHNAGQRAVHRCCRECDLHAREGTSTCHVHVITMSSPRAQGTRSTWLFPNIPREHHVYTGVCVCVCMYVPSIYHHMYACRFRAQQGYTPWFMHHGACCFFVTTSTCTHTHPWMQDDCA